MVMRLMLLTLVGWAAVANAEGTLTLDQRISSEVLGYDLRYRVYEPDSPAVDLPVLFVTDGPEYIRSGRMTRVLDRLIRRQEIEPLLVVFVDARDPDRRRLNRRNSQFLCNPDYLRFYQRELIPAIEAAYPVSRHRESRGILGLSFGGTNAACFGLLGPETFSRIGMHSPANYPVEPLLPWYEQSPKLPLTIFLSTGTPNDNTHANRKFRDILRDKGYPLHYVEVREDHNWDNWGPLVDDALIYLFGTADTP
jgi:enterochelin esterase-like enzyme